MDSLKGRPNRKKMLTDRISSDMIVSYTERLLEDKTSFNEFFSSVDPAYKAAFHNEFVNVWGFDKQQYLEHSFFVDLLAEVQNNNQRQGF